jgi:hypothetical protein
MTDQHAEYVVPPKGDRPRKIVVCSPDQYRDVHEAVMKLGHGDVLVRASTYVECGRVYIIDNDAAGLPPTPLRFEADVWSWGRLIDGRIGDAEDA